MRFWICIIIGLSTVLCTAQDMVVTYQAYYDTNSPRTRKEVLYVKNTVSVYEELLNTTEDWKQEEKDENTLIFPADYSGICNPYLMIDKSKKEIYFFDKIAKDVFLVQDIYSEFQWNITQETKEVSGYTCIKATAKYRGRTWEVWFTPDIAVSSGPWKLHGLPGLILEAYDITKKYTYVATKIEYKKNDLIDKDFKELCQTHNKKPITYKQFLEDKEEARLNFHQELSQKRGVAIQSAPIPRVGLELKYEWEE